MIKAPNRETYVLDISRGDSSEIEEVVACPLCRGYGSWNTDNGILNYDIENPTIEDTCDKYDGTGRLIATSRVKFRPMNSKKSLITQIVRNPENVI